MGQQNKLLMPLGQYVTLLDATLAAATGIKVEDIVVVTCHEGEAVARVADAHEIRVVHNPLFSGGMGTSLKAGIVTTHPSHALMIWPADMPFVSKATVLALIEGSSPDKIIRPTYDREPGHPVLFGRLFRESLLQIENEIGARSILSENGDATHFMEVNDSGVIRDIDTQADLKLARVRRENRA